MPGFTGSKDYALLALRLTAGVVFMMHGGQKLFVYGLQGVTATFGQMGIPLPAVSAPLVSLVEFGGGALLILGLLTQLAALLLVADMLGAILLVHLKGGFFLPKGFEFAFAMLGISVALALAGPGAFSLDAKRRRL